VDATGALNPPGAAAAPPLRQPRGLKVLFFTEMWERFSYYGMRALLVLYLVQQLGYPRAEALALYGLYTGLVYLTPIAGGWLADRYLGMRRAAVIGGVVMMLGHFALAFAPLLQLGLGLLIVGNGFFKANTSAMVGALYSADDPRRAGGYTWFYMGVNLGALAAPLVVGSLGELLGWHWGFGAAGAGMAIGVGVLLRWQTLLEDAGLKPGQHGIGRQDLPLIAGHVLASAALVQGLLWAWPPASALFAALAAPWRWALGLLLLAALLAWPHRPGAPARVPLSRGERHRVLALGVVAFMVMFFWVGFEQAGGTLNLFAREQTDRQLFGFEFPATWLLSVSPLLIVLLAPAISALWLRLDATRWRLPDTAKQGLGMLVLALGFVVMAAAQARADRSGPVGPQWLLAVYLLHTVGELMLSPVGLAMVSRLAPARMAGLLMGVWMLSQAAANYLAGSLEALLAGSGVPLFAFLVGASAGAGLLMLLITPALQRSLAARD
jgi:POT family proton-dependent oligopeptide transporter